MIFPSGTYYKGAMLQNFEKYLIKYGKKLAWNEEKPCSTCLLSSFFSWFRVPKNPILNMSSSTTFAWPELHSGLKNPKRVQFGFLLQMLIIKGFLKLFRKEQPQKHCVASYTISWYTRSDILKTKLPEFYFVFGFLWLNERS